MSLKQVRNENYRPFIDQEGFFSGCELVEPPTAKERNEMLWHEKLEPFERLFYHNTLSSARRHANFFNLK